jgi:acetyl esterase/lipase
METKYRAYRVENWIFCGHRGLPFNPARLFNSLIPSFMKTPKFCSFSLLALFAAASAFAADATAPAPTTPDATATAPVTATPTPAVGPTSSADIPTPLTAGQVITLFPEGVPDWKDIGPEQFQNGTYTNISNPRMIVGLPPAGTPQNGTAIIFCAGGGYVHVALGSGMNSWLNPLGVTTFNLIYRCKEFGAPAPQLDVMRAVRLIRAHAAEFGINPNHIGVMGASAGGHVAASAATLYDDPTFKTGNALDSVSARPDFAVLIFSVLTMEAPYAHGQSKENLIGANPSQEMIDHYSLEKHVTAQTPPVFIIHTQGDTTVREENDLLFYAALRKNNVPSELHLYSYGPHGSGMGAAYGDGTIWPKICEEWMRYNNWLPQSPTSLMPQGLTITSRGGARGGRGGRGRGGPPAAAPAAPANTTPTAATSGAPAATGN